MTRITRRAALAAPLALPFVMRPRAVAADLHDRGAGMPTHSSVRLGAFRVNTLLAFTRPVTEDIQTMFGVGVREADFARVSRENFIPPDKVQLFFTPTLVDTGAEVVLFDTGVRQDGIVLAVRAAGYAPEDVGVVVLTHAHSDHIGGILGEDGSPTFPNARYACGAAEYDAWAGIGNQGFDATVKPLAPRMTFLADRDAVVPGITAMAAAGHTPGHMVFMLESEGKLLMLAADTANHYVWSLAKPDWEVAFDADPAAAAATRRRIFGMLAADRVPFIGYHMPFPARGYVETRGDGFHYVPETYQMML